MTGQSTEKQKNLDEAKRVETERELKAAMEHVHIPERMREEILDNVLKRQRERKPAGRNIRRFLATAAAILLATCVVSIPVSALVSNLLKARLENIPQETLDEIVTELHERSAEVEAYNQTRSLTEGELQRMSELGKAYRRGQRIPEKPLLQVEHEENAVPGELCLIKEGWTWHYPDREMTDEELLEIMEYNYTIDYALSQSEAVKDYLEDDRKRQEQMRERIREEGWTDEKEAIRIAKEQLREEIGDLVDELAWTVRIYSQYYAQYYTNQVPIEYFVHGNTEYDETIFDCQINAEDGSIINSHLHPDAMELLEESQAE